MAGAKDPSGKLAQVLTALKPEIRSMLAEDLPVDRQRIEEAFHRHEWGTVREHVHRVKGSAAFCRLEALRSISTRIEDCLKTPSPPDSDDLRELSHEVDQVLKALAELPSP